MRIPKGHDYDMHDTSPGGSGAVREQHCNTLQHSATHCNTLQHSAIPQAHDYDMHDTSPGGSGATIRQWA